MLFVTCSIAIALDVIVQQIKETPGLYYDYIGEAHLYNTELMTISELYEIMHRFPLTCLKSMNINFGSITLGV